MNYITEFKDALSASGYPTDDEIHADDKIHRAHRIGDKNSKKDIRYQLAVDGDFAYGWFIYQGEERRDFHSKGRQLTASEAVAQKARVDAQRKASKKAQAEAHRAASKRAEFIWNHSVPAMPENAYLARKDIRPGPCRERGGALIVPMYDNSGVLCSLQFIGDNNKKYLRDGAKGTLTLDGNGVVALAEGFATGMTVWQATGWTVVVCFDTAGIKAYSGQVRKTYGDAEVVICADDDQWVFKPGKRPSDISDDKNLWPDGDDDIWTQWRKNGLLTNPGIEAATAALKKVGGNARLVNPKFYSTASRPTDFNDLMLIEGLGIVSDQLLAEPAHVQVVDAHIDTDKVSFPFRILGYNDGVYYYFPNGGNQIIDLTASAHTWSNLMRLARRQFWEELFPKESPTNIALLAIDLLIEMSEKKGVFKQESSLRGTGCWKDGDKVILHCGDEIYVDGIQTRFEDFSSENKFVYTAAEKLIPKPDKSLDNYESARFKKLCEMPQWENSMSGTLLAGWLVIAPICAALDFRPHLYITGESDAGKSTIMDKIVKPSLGKFALQVDGGTTEPALRQLMGYDARPLVYDEAESIVGKETMQSVIELARKASTGAQVIKFGQKPFRARFCGCFSAIHPPINKVADENRFSFLVLKKNKSPTAVQDYDDLLAEIDTVLTKDFSSRLLARTIENFSTLEQNIKMFQRATRLELKAARSSQVIGTMLAGAYLLGRTGKVSIEEATKFLQDHKELWSNYAPINDDNDPQRLVQHICSSLIRAAKGDVSISDLIGMVLNDNSTEADKILRSYAIKVSADGIAIGDRSQNMERLLRGTDWEKKWHRTLSVIAGASRKNKEYFMRGVEVNATKLPIEIFAEYKPQQNEVYYEDDF